MVESLQTQKVKSSTIPKSWPELLTQDEKSEIRSALEHCKVLELDGHQANRDNFPLPTLSATLGNAQRDIFESKDIFVLRGLDPKSYSNADQILIFLEFHLTLLSDGKSKIAEAINFYRCPIGGSELQFPFITSKTILNFSAALIKAHTRSLLDENQPLLSTAQLDALETVVATPNKHHLKVSMQPGDLQFVNNCAILHAREPFQDDNVNKNTWFAYGSLVRTGYGDFLMTWATSDQSSSMETKTRGIGRLNLWLGRNRRFPIAHRTELFRHSPGALS
ncbi:uncharacterized protein L3040_009191 [Drepanopeziza brunnea f. sp. 'multigermtubi']|uniref:uncharacterized protein n=1 Tax=Drepanopeziza brunnea f. sp. 'multigermtubi' TaxID=698441 RepID=UPI00239CED14|nr:hypothetical protein L3040_009191 [Drepanopeziza brunnea f. sp. 'multigermtubi']